MRLLMLLFICFVLALNLSAQDNESITKAYPPKDPGKAAVLSLVLPGAGQMHNDQVSLGLGILALEGAFIGSGFLLRNELIPLIYPPEYAWQALFACAGVVHALQVLQAPVAAHRINKKNGYIATKPGIIGYLYPTANGAGFALVF